MRHFREVSGSIALSSKREDDGLYFELYQLASEQKRLEKVRSILAKRLMLIDGRLAEIARAMNIMRSHPYGGIKYDGGHATHGMG